MMYLFIFFMGLIAGIASMVIRQYIYFIGELKIDDSDPTEQPYLFLELKSLDKVLKSNYVSFKVTKENLLNRKNKSHE